MGLLPETSMFWSGSKQLKSTMKTWKLKKMQPKTNNFKLFSHLSGLDRTSTGPRLFGLLELQQWHVSLEMLLALVSSPLWLLTHPWKLVPWRYMLHRLDECRSWWCFGDQLCELQKFLPRLWEKATFCKNLYDYSCCFFLRLKKKYSPGSLGEN